MPSHDEKQPSRLQHHRWIDKFRNAFRGTAGGIQGQNSFFVHFSAALTAILIAGILRLTRIEWAVLGLCITVVLTAEMFNSAIETLAKAVDTQHNPQVGKALDIGSAAVLLAAIGAATVGTILLASPLTNAVGW